MGMPEPELVSLEATGARARLRWGPPSAWELESEPDWSGLECIRLVSAVFEDGAALGVAAIRPRDARGHGDDAVAARFVDAEGARTETSDALLSVEYDSARVPRRLGIEVWPDADSAPLRIAADRDPEGVDDCDAVDMTFRLGGVTGRGTYETLRES
jgi:hypothetical protein